MTPGVRRALAAQTAVTSAHGALGALAALAALTGCGCSRDGQQRLPTDAAVDASRQDLGTNDLGESDQSSTDLGVRDGGTGRPSVQVSGHQLLVNGAPFQLQGVCWNPVPAGGQHPADLDFSGYVTQDATLMQAAGINVLRTYEPLTDLAVLDVLYAHGIYVLEGIYPYGGSPASAVTNRVRAVVDHPAVLMWVIGNEWNYNWLYVGLSHADSLARLNEVAALIRAEDTTRPIATIYGEVPSTQVVDAMPLVDVWGLNVYRGLGFGDLFDVWATRSSKPMFLGEYGADAYNALTGMVDVSSQAEATTALTQAILAHSSAANPSDVCLGGAIFEWADEWWKDGAGQPGTHDVGGSAPGGGPHPDATFNEEWWGVVDIGRAPRPAYTALQTLYVTD